MACLTKITSRKECTIHFIVHKCTTSKLIYTEKPNVDKIIRQNQCISIINIRSNNIYLTKLAVNWLLNLHNNVHCHS